MSEIFHSLKNEKLISILKKGGVGLLRTDTIYGICARAQDKKAVRRIYKLKKRTKEKRAIVLISKIDDLKKLGIQISLPTKKILRKIWPSRISISFQCPLKKFAYLCGGKKSFAIRMPAKKSLRELIEKTGPLIAPSANWQNSQPASNIKEAQKYFKDKVDFYVDEGKVKNLIPSTIIEIAGKKIFIWRTGRDLKKLKKFKNFVIEKKN